MSKNMNENINNNLINCNKCLKRVPLTNFCQECGIKLPKISKCPICFEKKLLEITSCGHGCCKECFLMWNKNNKSCPICRSCLSEEESEDESEEEVEMEEVEELENNIENRETFLECYEENIMNICNICYSKEFITLKENDLILNYCNNCNKSIKHTIKIFKDDYNCGELKVKINNKLKICSCCNSKEIIYSFDEHEQLTSECLNCKTITPSFKYIKKSEYNKHNNAVIYSNLYP